VGYTGAHWRLVRDPVHDARALFDLVHDPGETRDVSTSEPAARREMERLAHAWDERR